jgi:hypothetical protein
MKALQRLKELKIKDSREKYPSVPDYAVPVPKYSDKSANGLTKCVIDFLLLSGHFAERTGNEGRTIDQRKEVIDVLGQRKTIGTVKRIPSSGTKGTSDIKAIINGKFIAIEIKYGKDRQSDVQKDYQRKVEASGGEYWIVRDFEQFMELYDNAI